MNDFNTTCFDSADVSPWMETAPKSSFEMIESRHGNPETSPLCIQVVQIIKSDTGKAIWEKFDFLRERYYGKGGIWSAGYFVSTVGLDEKLIEKYVKYQEKEDLGQAKLALD